MRALLVLVLFASVAHADGDRFSLMGLGTSITEQVPGWVFRIESRFDARRADEGGDVISGGHVGLDVWSANGRWGFSLPIGWYIGGEAMSMRSTIGGGIGLITLEGGGGRITGGLSPFANATIEKTAGELMLAIEGRLTRQVIAEQSDHTVYSVMLMAGRRFSR